MIFGFIGTGPSAFKFFSQKATPDFPFFLFKTVLPYFPMTVF